MNIKNPGSTPESVFLEAMQAFKEDRLSDYAKIMHPDALKEISGMMSELMGFAKDANTERLVLSFFPSAKSIEEVKKYDDQQMFVSFLQVVTQMHPEYKQFIVAADIDAVGHVLEGKDTVHVVARMKMLVKEMPANQLTVTSLKRTETGWGMLLGENLEVALYRIRKALKEPEK